MGYARAIHDAIHLDGEAPPTTAAALFKLALPVDQRDSPDQVKRIEMALKRGGIYTGVEGHPVLQQVQDALVEIEDFVLDPVLSRTEE